MGDTRLGQFVIDSDVVDARGSNGEPTKAPPG